MKLEFQIGSIQMWKKKDVTGRIKMRGILLTIGSWIVLSIQPNKGQEWKNVLYSQQIKDWQVKEQRLWSSVNEETFKSRHTTRICRDRTTVYFGKKWVSSIFFFALKVEMMGYIFLFSSTYLSIYLFLFFILYKDLL